MQQLQQSVPKALFCFWRDGNGCFVEGDLPIQCSSDGDFCAVGNLWNPFFFKYKGKSGMWGGSGDLGGFPNIPQEPLCPSRTCPGQTAGHRALQPPPAPAANTARVSQRLDFSPCQGTAQLLLPAINPEQLKQQEDKGAVPEMLPWFLCSHLGAAPLPLRGPSARNPRHPGWGEEAFLFHCEEGTISLSLPLSFSRRGAAPFHSQKFFSHFLTESRAGSEPSLPPTRSPHQQFLKTIREILGRDGSQLETCCAWPEDPSQISCRFPKSWL